MKSNGVRPYQHSNRPMSPSAVRPVRATATDSDPSADELLHRVRNPRGNPSALSPRGRAALERLESNAIRLRDAEAWDAPNREGLAEYREWADGVAA